MSLERCTRLIAGPFIIASVTLSYFQSRLWLWFTLFVGANHFRSALTRWCLMEDILRKLGVCTADDQRVPPNPAAASSAF
jgi:Inner membrane protein YgaP-like, transmembrane domain